MNLSSQAERENKLVPALYFIYFWSLNGSLSYAYYVTVNSCVHDLVYSKLIVWVHSDHSHGERLARPWRKKCASLREIDRSVDIVDGCQKGIMAGKNKLHVYLQTPIQVRISRTNQQAKLNALNPVAPAMDSTSKLDNIRYYAKILLIISEKLLTPELLCFR